MATTVLTVPIYREVFGDPYAPRYRYSFAPHEDGDEPYAEVEVPAGCLLGSNLLTLPAALGLEECDYWITARTVWDLCYRADGRYLLAIEDLTPRKIRATRTPESRDDD